MPRDLLGALSALAASLSWGASDFSGGYASRRHHPFQVLTLSAAIGLLPLVALLLLFPEGWPGFGDVVIAGGAGLAGTLGLAAFYRGLLIGRSAVVAPVASVIGALVPVLVGLIETGLPSAPRLAGFVLALISIWLVTQQRSVVGRLGEDGLRYGVLAGLGFGGFLTLIAQVSPEATIGPLIVSKVSGLILSLIYLKARGLPTPGPGSNWVAALAGVLDSAGNVFYLVGSQLTRLDVVAALSSLYPAGTVILGRLILKEEVTRRQWLGVSGSLLAIMLITA